MSDLITEIIESRNAPAKLPPAIWLRETPVDHDTAEVRDEQARLRYTVVHPHWYDTVAGKYTKAIPAVVAADVGDGAGYKTVGAMDKYGFAQLDWIVGIKSRATGKQYLTKPYALTRHNGAHTNAAITKGIYEYAKPADAFGQELGRAAKWGGIFRDVDIRAEVSGGGALAIQHTWHKEACDESEWYGVIWEVDCTAAEYLTLIQPDGPHDTRLQPYVTEDKLQCIVEYFSVEQFRELDADGKPTGRLVDITHDYTTISVNLAAALALAADTTYYLTALCNLGTYNVTSTSTLGHEAIIKTNAAYGFRVNSTGTWNVSYVKFTSKNDDTIGEAIAGSSGSPAAADQTVGYVQASGTGATSVASSHVSFNYCTPASNSTVYGWTANKSTRTFTDTDISFRNIAVTVNAGGLCYGSYNSTNGAVTVDGLSIDSTVTTNQGAGMIRIRNVAANCSITNVTNLPDSSVNYSFGIIFVANVNGVVFTAKNCVCGMSLTGNALYLHQCVTAGVTATVNYSNCLAVKKGAGNANGFQSSKTAGTVNYSIIDSICLDCVTGVSNGGGDTVTHTYNDYYGCTANAFEALTASEITTNPALGNLPAGCVIDTATCNRPNGYAVTGFEMNGSDTFDNLTIDEAVYTSTGWKHAGTKLVTMGPMYALTTFPEVITSLTPNSGSTAGGTAVAWAGLGFGTTQGTGKVYLDGVEQTVTAWADDGPDITTIAHATGAVDASCTNYRGATFSLAGAFTFVTTLSITSLDVISGTTAGGTTVVITGTGFGAVQGAGTVDFGGTAVASYALWGDTSITIVTPMHAAGLVDVTVDLGGASVTKTGAFTFISPIPPAVGDDLEDLLGVATLWDIGFDWRDNPTRRVDLSRDVLELSTSRIELIERTDYLAQEVRYGITGMTAEETHDLIAFFAARLGRYRKFWLPVPTRRFTLTENASTLDTHLTVTDSNFAEFAQGYERVIVYMTDGARITRGIESAADNGDGTEQLNIITPLYRDIIATDVQLCCPLLLVRFAEDELNLSHKTAHVASAAVGFMELVREYTQTGGS